MRVLHAGQYNTAGCYLVMSTHFGSGFTHAELPGASLGCPSCHRSISHRQVGMRLIAILIGV
jgi:hypothetical protein